MACSAIPLGMESMVDDETENWPVPENMHANLDAIKYDYKVQPLPVYTEDNHYVKPADIIDTISGVFVQLQFELVHYHISKRHHDSFNGTIAQIIVIKPGAPPTTSSLKHKNIRCGPMCPNPLLITQNGIPTCSCV
ncbi:hypothetical protein EI94DRAFT_1703548 [Lactarius quietus]|nr:hypothetical protein EI94DRAFT_1703548 [Lactarius quietus]